jgi:alpha/beta superfamily hydrolase
MHGNSSARVEALTQLSLVLSLGATLVSFDFCGSGRSDGNYVSLGAFEKDDLKVSIFTLYNDIKYMLYFEFTRTLLIF